MSTSATVLTYSFDPDGGDPDGWSTDNVRFLISDGATVVATVGHHAAGREQTTRRLPVTYDPQNPGIVRAAGYEDDADDPLNALVGAVMSLLIGVVASRLAMGTLIIGHIDRRRRRALVGHLADGNGISRSRPPRAQ